MPIIVSYIAVIIIWSTTPLAIKWSNDGTPPIAAASMRMLLAATAAMLVILLLRRFDFFSKKHYKNYAVASLSLFPNLPLVYYSAQYIPSGLISVIFGLSPLFTALFSILLLKDNFLTPQKLLAQVIALTGLACVTYEQMALGDEAIWGVLLMLASTVVYAGSNVWLKQISTKHSVPAFEQTCGALVFSLPGLLLCWFLVEGNFAVTLTERSLLSMMYLGLIGSLVGFVAFYYVLNRMSLSLMSLIPVITPMIALVLGAVIAGESLGLYASIGVALIIVGLVIYEGLPKLLLKSWRQWQTKNLRV